MRGITGVRRDSREETEFYRDKNLGFFKKLLAQVQEVLENIAKHLQGVLKQGF